MSQRFEGRNLEDALNHASAALGVERWQLTYHVLMEKRGFLGGVKRVVIEADINREAPPPAPTAAASAESYAEPRPPRSDPVNPTAATSVLSTDITVTSVADEGRLLREASWPETNAAAVIMNPETAAARPA